MTTVNILRVAMPSVTQAQHDRLLLEAQRERARVKRAAARREVRRLAQARRVRGVLGGFEDLNGTAA